MLSELSEFGTKSAFRNDSTEFPFKVCKNTHGSYCVPDIFSHREVPKVLAQGAVYEPKTLKKMEEHYKGGDVVSGGAFVGDFFPAIAGFLDVESTLFSFEPHPISFLAARKTINLNRLENVQIAPVAVGDAVGRPTLKVTGNGGKPLAAASRIVANEKAHSPDCLLSVDMTRLDDLIPEDRHVSLLHLDVEGHEEAALDGAKQLLNRCSPIVVLETPRRRRRMVIDRYLAKLNHLTTHPRYKLLELIDDECNVFFGAC